MAIPMAVIGVVIGSATVLFLSGGSTRDAWVPLLVDVATVVLVLVLVLVWVAVHASTRMTWPWLVRAAAPANLRTP
ncbi:MAG: hypothetical protein H0V32_02600 [Nocardioidaceae bacterium]|nr:hypothetical protein [Nocardioidaceae bacterium]